MTDPLGRETVPRDPAAQPAPPDDIASEAERTRTPPTPFLALTGIWLTVAAVVAAVLITVALTLYFV